MLSTPALNVGVSFDVPDHFDHLMVYGSSHSCCVRDAMQATQRVRKFKSNVMYYCVYGRPRQESARRPDTLWAIERDLEHDARHNEQLCEQLEVHVMPLEKLHPAVRRVMALNRLEENLSKRYYRQIWDAYLVHLGYDVIEECDEGEITAISSGPDVHPL